MRLLVFATAVLLATLAPGWTQPTAAGWFMIAFVGFFLGFLDFHKAMITPMSDAQKLERFLRSMNARAAHDTRERSN